jgi:hypothetical protein
VAEAGGEPRNAARDKIRFPTLWVVVCSLERSEFRNRLAAVVDHAGLIGVDGVNERALATISFNQRVPVALRKRCSRACD